MTTALQFWISNLVQLSINCTQGGKNNQHIARLFLHLININSVLFCLKLYVSSLPTNSPPQFHFSSNTVKELIQNFLFLQDLCLQLMSSDLFSCVKVYVFEIWMCGFQSQLYKYFLLVPLDVWKSNINWEIFSKFLLCARNIKWTETYQSYFLTKVHIWELGDGIF